MRSDDRSALAYLASRAVATRLYRELRAVSDDPVADLAAARYEDLASLELDHLGLRTGLRQGRASRSSPDADVGA